MELCSLLRRLAHAWPNAAAIESEGESLSYSELFERVDSAARALETMGCRSGARMAFMSRSGMRFAELLLALSQLGAVLVPVGEDSAQLPPDVGFAFIGRELSSAPPCIPEGVKVISEDGGDFGISYRRILRRKRAFRPERAASGSDALLQMPEGRTYASREIAEYVEVCRLNEPTRELVNLPPACLSFVRELCLVLASGGTAVLPHEFRAKDWIYALADGVDRVFLTQTMAEAVLRDSHYLRVDFSALRTIRCGLTLFEKDTLAELCEKLPKSCIIEKEFGFPVPEARLTVTLEESARETSDGYVLIGSVGRPTAGGAAAAFEGRCILPFGQVGELRINRGGEWKSIGARGHVSRDGYVFLSRDSVPAGITMAEEPTGGSPMEELADLSASLETKELCRRASEIIVRALELDAAGVSACRFEMIPAVTAGAIAEQAEKPAREIPMPDEWFCKGRGFSSSMPELKSMEVCPLRSPEGKLFGGLYISGGRRKELGLIKKLLTRLLEAHESIRSARMQCELFRQTAQLASEGVGISRVEAHPALLFANDIASEQINIARQESVYGKKLEKAQTENMHALMEPDCASSSRSFYTHAGERKLWVNYRAEKITVGDETFAVCFSNTQDNRSSTRHLESILTPREIEIVDLLSRGASNKDMAAALGVSVNTVKYHLARVYEKMEVSSRTELLSGIYMKDYRKK